MAAGTVSLRRCDAGWRRRTSIVAAVEAVLLTGGAAGWLATDAHPGRSSAPLILALAAAAMGVQSVATISSGARVAPSWALALPAVLVAAVVMVTAVLARHGMEGS
ncbi:MAG: hypothetical protein JWP76_1811 [Dactylosporangium sp.]|nr:hypothetical protein [Dactylosporangium sp.]